MNKKWIGILNVKVDWGEVLVQILPTDIFISNTFSDRLLLPTDTKSIINRNYLSLKALSIETYLLVKSFTNK